MKAQRSPCAVTCQQVESYCSCFALTIVYACTEVALALSRASMTNRTVLVSLLTNVYACTQVAPELSRAGMQNR